MNKHQLNTLEITKIKYWFQKGQYDYKLPTFGVDLEFLALRRGEILGHMETLKAKVATIDFTTLEGAEEFYTASDMVKWYQLALRTINQQQYMIELDGKQYNPTECTEAQARYMYHATRERKI